MQAVLSNIFGSVMMRLALIYGALAIMTGAAITIGWMVFQSIAINMAVMSENSLPELRKSATVVTVADRIRTVLTDTLVAETPEELDRLNARTRLILADIRGAVDALPSSETELLNSRIDTVETALADVTTAISKDFSSSQRVADAVEEVMQLANTASGLLAQQTDSAYFNLVLGSDDTISSIDQTLSALIEQDFALYQSALEVRAEINLLSGLAMGVSQTRDSAMLSILRDIANASTDRLNTLLKGWSDNDLSQDVAGEVALATKSFSESIQGTGPRLKPNEIVSIRQSVDAALSSKLDDVYFDLVIKSDDAKTQNETSIRNLMDTEVSQIRAQAALDSATKAFFAEVMQTALSRNPSELAMRSDGLGQAAVRLEAAMDQATPEVVETLSPILAIATPESGIVAIRQASFTAKDAAREATNDAANAVREISSSVNLIARAAQDGIDTTAAELNEQVAQAREQMIQIGIASLFLVIAAPILIWKMVTSPLNKVTAVTERLAQGDLSEITNLNARTGELARLSDALRIFREGALDRIKLQEEDKKRQLEALETERATEKAKRDAEEQERSAEAARLKEEQIRADKEQKRIDEARDLAEAERQARAKEQETVVDELATGLKNLSHGDLSHRIDTPFPGNYETLRHDFNAAVKNLSELIKKIGLSSGNIDANSAEIASSSLDLSRRTENAAATLEETSAALNELTVSVSSAAKGASIASSTVNTVKDDAEASKEVMHEAVTAMREIEQSSTKIAQIVEVIDAISFQTNLLALNAGVEAARAGDAGRGFAVVASEVRSLAHRCSDAALQINGLITESSNHVQTGVSRIEQTSAALENILSGITDMSKNVSEIAVSANEQSGGIAEINTAVEQLDRSTQQNAAMFEESTAASQALKSEASQLAQVVAGFVVTDGDPKAEDAQYTSAQRAS